MVKIIYNKEGYKEGCGFREKLDKVCTFKSENCNKVDCDMFNIKWDKTVIKSKIEIEQKSLRKLSDELKSMKKEGLHKTDKHKYKELKRKGSDLAIGICYLTEAYDFLCGGKYSKIIAKFPRLAKKFKIRAEDLEKEKNEMS